MFEKLKSNLKKNYFEYALYLFAVSFFLGNALISIAYSIFLLASVFEVFKNFRLREFWINIGLVFPCIFFLFNLSIVLTLGEDLEDILKVEKLHSLLVLPIIFFSTRNHFKQDKTTLLNLKRVFLLAAFISFSLSFLYGLYRVFFAETILNSIYITYNHLAELFGVQPLYMAVFYLMAIIFCFDLTRIDLPNRKIYFTIGIILFFGIVLLSSRTGLLLSIIILLVKLLEKSYQLKMRKLIMLFSPFLILGLVLTMSIPTLKKRVLNFNENISSYSGASLRTKIWKNSFEVFKGSPIYGYGFYKSQEELMNQYKKTNFRRGFINNLNSHNQYLQTLLDSGIIGFVFLLLMLIFPLKNISNIPLTYSLFQIIIIISLIPESFFLRQYGVLFYSFFSSIFYISHYNRKTYNLK